LEIHDESLGFYRGCGDCGLIRSGSRMGRRRSISRIKKGCAASSAKHYVSKKYSELRYMKSKN
jgi:hypothetical protein